LSWLYNNLGQELANSLILIGFKSAGKSTLAKQLAAMLELPMFDLDTLMLEKFGYRDIQTCFKSLGESNFRQEEALIVEELRLQQQPMIVATGGGAVLNPSLMASLKSLGKIVFLNTEYETIEQRLFKGNDRLFYLNHYFHKDELKALYQTRLPVYYSYADIIIGAQ
jgi:shikimate kinase